MNLDHTHGHAITREMILAEADQLLHELHTDSTEKQAHHLRQSAGKKIACLVEPILQKVGVACLAGSSDTGKSALLRQLATAVTAGDTDFIGFPIHATHRSVLYVATEDGEEATSFLLSRQTAQYTDEHIERLRFIFEYEDLIPMLHESLTRQPADMVIIDCYSDIYEGDLKDTQKIRTFLKSFQWLARKHKCLILFLHHTGKRTESLIPSKNNLLSGQGLEAKMRLVMELRLDPMRPNDRHLCIVKGNYLPAMMKRESYVLHFDEQNFTFTTTGERTPFELLVRGAEVDESRAKYEEAKELKEKGMSYSKIAEAMGYASKNSITKLFEKAVRLGRNQQQVTESEEEND